MDYKKLKFTVNPSPLDGRDWKVAAIYTDFITPRLLDYRPQMTIVRDQGDQGSCAAMAGAAMKEWQERLDFNYTDYMSPQFIYNLREDMRTPGMHMRNLMKILQKVGVVPESVFPYAKQKEPPSIITMGLGDKFRIQKYAQVSTVDELEKALVVNGPCVIAVPVYNYGPTMWIKEKGDVFLGGHAMLVVGYDHRGFILRNSWGRAWGDFGHCYFSLDQWGQQWEVWSSIDEDSFKDHTDYENWADQIDDDVGPDPDPDEGKPFKKKTPIWPYVVAALVGLGFLYHFVL